MILKDEVEGTVVFGCWRSNSKCHLSWFYPFLLLYLLGPCCLCDSVWLCACACWSILMVSACLPGQGLLYILIVRSCTSHGTELQQSLCTRSSYSAAIVVQLNPLLPLPPRLLITLKYLCVLHFTFLSTNYYVMTVPVLLSSYSAPDVTAGN